jgi:hypothetical protein
METLKKASATSISTPVTIETTDPDLVELSGKHSYRDGDLGDIIPVNGKKFEILDTRYNDPSGLDAMTVQNIQTGEVSIIYQGTQAHKENGMQDIITDAQLTTDTPSIAQLEASEAYYKEMDELFGVSSVAGNSLGGPLAFSALRVNPDLRCVTFNPAPTPKGYLDPKKVYRNAINFYDQHDPLTSTTTPLGMQRVPGEVVTIEAGAAIISSMGSIHTGFKEGSITVRGITISTAADDHIVTSLWTGETLTGESSTRIDVNLKNLDILSKGLVGASNDFGLAQSYMEKSEEIVLNEESIFTMRLETMISTFNDMIEDSIYDPVLKGITRAQSAITSEVSDWLSKLDTAEQHFQSINAILNSPPVELIEHIISVDISVESLFQEARDHINKFFLEVCSLSNGIAHINEDVIPSLLSEAQNKVDDFLVNEMRDHYTIVNSNTEKVSQQIVDFGEKVVNFKEELEKRDLTSALSIKMQANAISDIVKIPGKSDFLLEESNHLLLGMKLKELVLESSFNHISNLTHILIGVPAAAIASIVGTIEAAVKGISLAISKVFDFSHSISLPASLFPQFQEIEQKLKLLANSITRPLDDIGSMLGGVRDSFFRLSIYLPDLLREFKPYLDDAIFTIINYNDINVLNLFAMTQLKELKVLLQDVSFQLSEHSAKSIEALGETSNLVIENLDKLTSQIKKVTFE